MERGPERQPSPPPASEIALALALYTAFTVWWLWPLPTTWQTHTAYFGASFPPSVADVYLIIWAMTWDAHALVAAPWRLFHANIFYPSTLSLAYSEHFLGYVPLFAPTYWASGNPILAVNGLIFVSYPLCALSMYALARRWTGGPAAAVAGFFYAFYPYRYQTLTHLHMLGVHYLPLAMLLTERWLVSARARDAALLAGALLLQAFSSTYLAYVSALAYGPYLAIALCRWRGRLDRRRLAGLALAGGFVLAMMVVMSLPYLELSRLGLIPSYGEEGATPIGLVPYFASIPVWRYLREQGVGGVGYALALLAILPPWRRLRYPRLVGAVTAVVGTVAAFGPKISIHGHALWSPYTLLVDWVPGFATVRQPGRFVLAAQLGFALLAGIGLGRIVARARPWVAWPAAAASAAAALWTFSPLQPIPLHAELTGNAVPPVYRWLGRHGAGRVLLEEPPGDFVVAARRMYLSTYHWLPIVEGYSGYPPGTAAHVQAIASWLPDASALQKLVDTVAVGWILVHRDQLPDSVLQRWGGQLPAGLERTGEWGSDLLLRVTLPVRDDRRARLLSTRETLEGTPLAPLGARCPGAIRLRVAPPNPWPPLSAALVHVEVANDGSAPWPAAGYYPRHLVRLRVALNGPRGPAMSPQTLPLPRDVPPGGSVTVPVSLKAPFIVGDGRTEREFTLELELVQVRDGPLARCGVAPLSVPVRVGAAG